MGRAACARATRNRLAVLALETLKPEPALSIAVTFAETPFQIHGIIYVGTIQHFDTAVLRVVLQMSQQTKC